MRRSALFLLTLHLAAAAASAQTPYVAAPVPAEMQPVESRPLAPVSESLVSFDPQQVEVVWSQNHWQLTVNGHVLKDFGRREVEARLAARLVRDLRLTQHGFVGSPEPVMEYWLSNGRAPYGMTTGLRMTQLDPQDLRVEQTQGQWTVRDNSRVLFNFGRYESDAHNALGIIRKYGFTQIGILGNAGPSMLIMLGRTGEVTGDEANLPRLARQSPLRQTSVTNPQAAKAQAAKPLYSDTHPVITPIVPPIRQTVTPQTQRVNAFGKTETIEVLPVRDPQRPAAPATTQRMNSFGKNETVEVLPVSEPFSPRRTPPPSPLALEWIDRTAFDWRQFQVRPEGGQYVLKAGGQVLARFNTDKDARLALSTLQHYRFTELNRIGRPQTYCSYFLCSGQAPRGQYFGPQSEAFQPDKLSVTQIEGRWAIVTPEKPLLWFGDKPEEARVMLDVIHRQQFDRLCRIGDERGLTYFIRSR